MAGIETEWELHLELLAMNICIKAHKYPQRLVNSAWIVSEFIQ